MFKTLRAGDVKCVSCRAPQTSSLEYPSLVSSDLPVSSYYPISFGQPCLIVIWIFMLYLLSSLLTQEN